MCEGELVSVFIRSQEPDFYNRMLTMAGRPFVEFVKMGEAIEDGLKFGKIVSLFNKSSRQATAGIFRKKKEDVESISHFPNPSPNEPQSTHITTPLINYPTPVYYAQPSFTTTVPAYTAPSSVRGNGHSTEDCINLKHKIKDLIDKREITLETAAPNMNTNPLPNHGNNGVHMIERNEDWEACRALNPKRSNPWDTHASNEDLAELVAHIIGEHKICFSKEDLPVESTAHGRALNITVEWHGKAIRRVLVDTGSGLNICPITTLTYHGCDVGKIRHSGTNVRGFDGSLTDSLGEIDLQIQVGPASFTTEFQ
ncbi:uncharacterized protein LOC132044460, partial [Lycium ferocissimum]|uniref:uncharacterized protein LOC132044460 n=1 Tax=Lycium ferocissimum TaxID=112874 RepID=UPI002815485F